MINPITIPKRTNHWGGDYCCCQSYEKSLDRIREHSCWRDSRCRQASLKFFKLLRNLLMWITRKMRIEHATFETYRKLLYRKYEGAPESSANHRCMILLRECSILLFSSWMLIEAGMALDHSGELSLYISDPEETTRLAEFVDKPTVYQPASLGHSWRS